MEIFVSEATLQSYMYEVDAIELGIDLYEAGKVESSYNEKTKCYVVEVNDAGIIRNPSIKFTRDGEDIKEAYCQCGDAVDGALCEHIVAGILAIQGGFFVTEIAIDEVHQVSATVDKTNTAIAMKSGSLPVFATPSMVALMEQAASELLDECISEEQTSVGTLVDIAHLVASPVGTQITATATIQYVFGRKIEFIVTATDGENEIGRGRHTRMIVDTEEFMSKL